MVHPRAKMTWLNTETQECRTDYVTNLYQDYSVYAQELRTGSGWIDFNSKNIMVQDLYGWTQLLMMRKITGLERVDWVSINPRLDPKKFLVLNYRSVLPVYSEPLQEKIGFHGEVKYRFQLKEVKDIDPEKDRIRIRFEDEFGQIMFKIHIGKSSSCPPTGYLFVTKSGFINVNGFHISAQGTGSDKNIMEDNSYGWK